MNKGRDGCVRTIAVEYQNNHENTKRRTVRGVRDVAVIHCLLIIHFIIYFICL